MTEGLSFGVGADLTKGAGWLSGMTGLASRTQHQHQSFELPRIAGRGWKDRNVMANKNLFKTATPGPKIRATDTVNEAGGRAYRREDRAALAQYAATGTLASTFY